MCLKVLKAFEKFIIFVGTTINIYYDHISLTWSKSMMYISSWGISMLASSKSRVKRVPCCVELSMMEYLSWCEMAVFRMQVCALHVLFRVFIICLLLIHDHYLLLFILTDPLAHWSELKYCIRESGKLRLYKRWEPWFCPQLWLFHFPDHGSVNEYSLGILICTILVVELICQKGLVGMKLVRCWRIY